VSSAILYAAIVAIWAGVLIPRWLKRDSSQTARTSPDVTGGQPAGADSEAHADGAETMTGDIAGHDAETGRGTADAGKGAARENTARESTAPAAAHEDTVDERSYPAGYDAERAETRQRIVTARRRMLLILITLTVAAIGITGLKMAAWWVAVPPILMLGGYLMLLREASRADRERILLDAAAYRDEQRERYAEEQAARRAAEVPAAPVVSPTARVIDISERVRDEDEIYDQYADGTRRAVGD
jgi:hypothetical protein